MKPYDILKKSKEFGIMYEAAIPIRLRYLVDSVAEYAANHIASGCEVSKIYAFRAIDEIIALKGYRRKEGGSKITEEMIERARNYPVSRLIRFRHGKATAWCHEDKNPSLYHATRQNRANCPVCDKSFDAIGVLMSRDGCTFAAAVEMLQ